MMQFKLSAARDSYLLSVQTKCRHTGTTYSANGLAGDSYLLQCKLNAERMLLVAVKSSGKLNVEKLILIAVQTEWLEAATCCKAI